MRPILPPWWCSQGVSVPFTSFHNLVKLLGTLLCIRTSTPILDMNDGADEVLPTENREAVARDSGAHFYTILRSESTR